MAKAYVPGRCSRTPSGILPPYCVCEAKSAARLAWVCVEPRRSRLYGNIIHTTSQIMPSEPVAMKEARQPQCPEAKPISRGARKKLTFEPELKRPTALP